MAEKATWALGTSANRQSTEYAELRRARSVAPPRDMVLTMPRATDVFQPDTWVPQCIHPPPVMSHHTSTGSGAPAGSSVYSRLGAVGHDINT